MTTANLLMGELAESQSSKSVTINEALHVLDALVQCAIIDRDLATPPGSPVNGNVYIVAGSPTGAWVGHTNHLAQWDVTAWRFHVPEEGWTCYVRDEDALLVYTGSAWTVLAGSGAVGVTSVALSMPAELSVSGSPITTSGTLAVTKAVQNANKVFAGPTTGADAAPAFRALVAADQVTMVGDSGSGGTKGVAPAPAAGDAAAGKFLKADGTWAAVAGASGGTVTSVAFTAPAEFSVSGSPVTSSGTLAVTKANQSANQVWAGPTSGSAAAPAFRALVAADIPAQPYDIGSFIEVAPTASQVVLRHVFARSVVFAAGLSPSRGAAGTAATASTTFTIKKNGSSVGSFNFAISATTATFTMASGTTFAAGDVMTVEAPATPDATLAGITFTLSGTR
jgi:hypothetical protein